MSRVGDATIINSVAEEPDEEALRVVMMTLWWNPGMQNGDYVKVYFALPQVFPLEN